MLLDELVDIVVDELPNALPPIRSISHRIKLIPGASLPNKVAYRLTPKENEEIKSHIQELSFEFCLFSSFLTNRGGSSWIILPFEFCLSLANICVEG